MENFITQLKRRQVFKVAGIYAMSAWPLIQIADLTVPVLGLPDSVMTLLLQIFVAGFPVSLIFAWLFNITNKGIVRASADTDADNIQQANFQTTMAVVGSMLVVLTITLGTQVMWGEGHKDGTTPGVTPPVTAAVQVAPPVIPEGKQSIAILPFVPFSNDPEDEFFADGMVEELLNLMAKLPDLHVAARTSSFAYKGITNKTIPQIGQELGVGNILEGSIRKNDTTNKVRITAQLIKVETGEHLWSETYDREYRDIFQIQDEIAKAVVKKLQITLLGDEQQPAFEAPTHSVDAMVAYGKGQKEMSHRTVMSLSKALEHFNQATELDPDYARAYVGIADANILLAAYGNRPVKEAREIAQQAIDRAFSIDINLAEAHASQGLMWRESEPDKAEESFKRAMELNPNYAMTYLWYGGLMTKRGEHKQSHELLETAFKLDPKSPVAAFALAWSHYDEGNEDKAMELFSHIIANDPYYPAAYNLVGQILLGRGRLDEAIDMFKRALDVDALNKGAVAGLVTATMDLGSFDKTEQWFDYAKHHDELFSPAKLNLMRFRYHIAQGHENQAFDHLDKVTFEDAHGHTWRNMIDGQKAYYQGNYAQAIEAFEQVRLTDMKTEESFYRLEGGRIAAHLAQAYSQMEMTDKLNELLSGFEQYLDSVKEKQANNASYYYAMALTKALRNNRTEAFYYLQGAIDVGWVQVWEAEIEPIFQPVSQDVQFTLMMGGVKARLANMRSRMSEDDMSGFEEI